MGQSAPYTASGSASTGIIWAKNTSPLMIKRFLTTGGNRPKDEGGR